MVHRTRHVSCSVLAHHRCRPPREGPFPFWRCRDAPTKGVIRNPCGSGGHRRRVPECQCLREGGSTLDIAKRTVHAHIGITADAAVTWQASTSSLTTIYISIWSRNIQRILDLFHDSSRVSASLDRLFTKAANQPQTNGSGGKLESRAIRVDASSASLFWVLNHLTLTSYFITAAFRPRFSGTRLACRRPRKGKRLCRLFTQQAHHKLLAGY